MQQRAFWASAACVIAASWLSVGHGSAEEPLIGQRQALIFQQACAHCHVRPGIGVPLLGDATEWEARREQGFETLVANTVEGVADMPPLGTCSFCTEDDLRRLVAFIAGYAVLPRSPEAAP